ncbi:MAG: hypothetical protein HYV09_05245 [Deltaproteobacteria bacterium]|nr:hypothetical protein [Deltaproteobacteria bacterium]
MTPRRKPIPAPIERRSGPTFVLARVLAPATRASRLPTAAALAIALAGAGCLLPEDESVRADPATRSVQTIKAMSSAKSAKADAGPMIDPDPMPLPGEAAIVLPAPVPSPVPSPVSPVSSTHPRVAGRMPAIHLKPPPTGTGTPTSAGGTAGGGAGAGGAKVKPAAE